MKIGILVDSHDHLPNLRKALSVFKERGCEKILHAGDFTSPFVMNLFKEFTVPLLGVFGNNDGDWLFLTRAGQGIADLKKGPLELELAGRKIALMHEPVFLDALRESEKFDLIIFGHTHGKVLETGKTLVLNPGECCGYLTGKATVAVCDLEKMSAEIISL
jgi:uncharacterized protein